MGLTCGPPCKQTQIYDKEGESGLQTQNVGWMRCSAGVRHGNFLSVALTLPIYRFTDLSNYPLVQSVYRLCTLAYVIGQSLDLGVQSLDLGVQCLDLGVQSLDQGVQSLNLGVQSLDRFCTLGDVGQSVDRHWTKVGQSLDLVGCPVTGLGCPEPGQILYFG